MPIRTHASGERTGAGARRGDPHARPHGRVHESTCCSHDLQGCCKSGIEVRYAITEVSYYEFLVEYEPVPLSDDQLLGKQQQVQHSSKAVDEELDCDTHGGASMTIKPCEAVEVDAHERDVHAQLVEARKQLATKDEQLAAKDEQLAAKDAELQQLRAQVALFEGVPP